MAEAAQQTGLVANPNASQTGDDESPTEGQGGSFFDSLRNIEFLRQVTIILSLTICLALVVVILLWAYEPDRRPVGDMTTDEMVQTLDFFDQNNIDYTVEGKTVYVLADQYENIRMKMIRAGLKEPPSDGTDILMQDMGFGVSQRMEQQRLNYSREQQLAKAIEALKPVGRARVLLAIPKQNVFARHQAKPSATVVVGLATGRSLSQEEVDSIVDIVASAIHNMDPAKVTVTDENGRLLNSGSQDPLSVQSRREYELQRKREAEYVNKINTIMMPVVGLDNYTAQVDVSMDFTAIEQTQRRYNPDLPALRSEMTVEDNSSGRNPMGIPGALSNQPPTDSSIPEEATDSDVRTAVPSKTHKQATRNFELDTTLSHTRQQVGTIKRLSISVALANKSVTDADGNTTSEPYTQAEIDNIRRLLMGGLGFDSQRGDTLEVVSIPFARGQLGQPEEVPFYEKPIIGDLIRWGSGALVVIVLILAVMRPMFNRLIGDKSAPEDETLLDGPLADRLDTTMLAAQDALDGDEDGIIASLTGGQISLPDLHKDEDFLKAVRALVANEPELSVQVVKSWLEEQQQR